MKRRQYIAVLKRLFANNFRSLLNFEFKPVGLNLLVGPNNAGKTNLCSSLRFISLSSITTLENAALNAIGESWRLNNVYFSSSQIDLTVECVLTYQGQPLDFQYQLVLESTPFGPDGRQPLRLIDEKLIVHGGCFQQMPLLENRGGQARLLHEEGFVQRHANSPFYVETLSAGDATMLSRLYELRDNPRASLFKRYLRSWLYFSLSPEALRSPDVLRDYPFLRHDGTNLARSLFVLHNEQPRLERNLIELVKPLEPKLDLFTFVSPDPEHVYLFLEDEKGNRFSTRSMSDGTLRFLTMAYIILTASNAMKNNGLLPLIIIEEPENGLHVGHLKPLLEKIDASGQAGQFIFTSHSPYFIDLFDSNLEGIHLLKPGKPSSSLVRLDSDKVRKLLDQLPLGEMHYRELLG